MYWQTFQRWTPYTHKGPRHLCHPSTLGKVFLKTDEQFSHKLKYEGPQATEIAWIWQNIKLCKKNGNVTYYLP